MSNTISHSRRHLIRSGMTVYRVYYLHDDVVVREYRPLGKFHLNKQFDRGFVGAVDMNALMDWTESRGVRGNFDVQAFAKAHPDKIRFDVCAETMEDPEYSPMTFGRNSFWYCRANNDGLRLRSVLRSGFVPFRRSYTVDGEKYGTVIHSFVKSKGFVESGLIPTSGKAYGSGWFTNRKSAEKFADQLRENTEWMAEQRRYQLEMDELDSMSFENRYYDDFDTEEADY